MMLTVIGVLISFTINNQNESFGLAWALLYPTMFIMALGHHWGLRLAIFVYLILCLILYNGIGIWLQDNWDLTSLIRFTLAYIASTFMVYVMSVSNTRSYKVLETQHINQVAVQKW